MRYGKILAIPVAAFASALGCGVTEGNGDFGREVRSVTSFAAIDASGPIHSYIHVDPTIEADRTMITVTGDANLLPLVVLDVNAVGALEISDGDDYVLPRLELAVEMRIRDLVAVTASDDAGVIADNITTSHFNLDASDGATLLLTGKVMALDAEASDEALIEAKELEAEYAGLILSDFAHANVCVSNHVNVEAGDEARIDVYCDPLVVDSDIEDEAEMTMF
jgi:hypothetical protein